MTRSHLLSQSLKPAVPARRNSVWGMTMAVLGHAFGARSARGSERLK